MTLIVSSLCLLVFMASPYVVLVPIEMHTTNRYNDALGILPYGAARA